MAAYSAAVLTIAMQDAHHMHRAGKVEGDGGVHSITAHTLEYYLYLYCVSQITMYHPP